MVDLLQQRLAAITAQLSVLQHGLTKAEARGVPDFYLIETRREAALLAADHQWLTDIIAAIVYAVDEKVLEAEGRQGKAALQEGYLTRLWHWLTTTDVELGEGELAVGDAGKLVFELKTRDSLRQRVRRTVAANLTAFLGQAREELVALEERARRAGWGGLIVVLDSLEKLRGVS